MDVALLAGAGHVKRLGEAVLAHHYVLEIWGPFFVGFGRASFYRLVACVVSATVQHFECRLFIANFA